MRVIAGTYRSRILVAPEGIKTRPTSDRLRETLFNVIASRIPGCRFLDLYAGSGAVGIEAISRGAAHVWFAESAAPAIAAIRANLRALKITEGVTLNVRGVLPLLTSLAGPSSSNVSPDPDRTPADLIFLDPPYEAADEYSTTLQLLGAPSAPGAIVANHTLVIAEHSKKVPLAPAYGALIRTRVLEQGDAALSFFTPGD